MISIALSPTSPIDNIDLLGEYLTYQAEQVVAKKEILILSVLPENISILELANDCKWLYCENTKTETLYYKDAPVLTLYPLTLETHHGDHGSVSIHTTQKYLKH